MELYVLPPLVQHADTLNIDLRKFFFFKNLTAGFELENGLVLGRRASTG